MSWLRIANFRSTLTRLRSHSPASHVTAFLVLHELTAILPLPLLVCVLSAWDKSHPEPLFTVPEKWREGADAFAKRIVTRFTSGTPVNNHALEHTGLPKNGETGEKITQDVKESSIISQDSARLLVNVATAYALVKMALPLRIFMSTAMTPAFARHVIIPMRDTGIRFWHRIRKASPHIK